MQGLSEKLNQGADFAKGKAGEISTYLKGNPTVAAMLLAGGGAGLAGGLLTARQPKSRTESRSGRRLRILRNALLAGGAGAGAVGLGAMGFNRLSNAVPEGTKNPVEEKLTSTPTRVAGAAGAAAYGYSKGNKADMSDFKNQALRTLSKTDAHSMVGASPDEVVNFAKSHNNFTPRATNLLSQLTGKIKPNLLRKVTEGIVGNTRGGQLARGGAALGAFLPEVISKGKDMLLEQ